MSGGGWHHDDANWKRKQCAVVQHGVRPLKRGAHKFCSSACRGKWKYITGAGSTEEQYIKISGNWQRYFSRLLRAGGKKRSDLSVSDLQVLYEAQGGKCALSGVPLTCILEKGKKTTSNASVDRINAGGEYVIGNIQLVCIAVNKWRGDTPVEEFISWCTRVAEHNYRKNNDRTQA